MQTISVRLPDDLKAWLSKRAGDEERSLNGQIVQLIKAAKTAGETKGGKK